MTDVIVVDENNFEAEVLNSELPVLLDISAVWCRPCSVQLPIVEKFATENLGKIKVCKVDIDEAPTVAIKYGIRGVPTLLLFIGGGLVGSKVGLTAMAELSNFVVSKTGLQ